MDNQWKRIFVRSFKSEITRKFRYTSQAPGHMQHFSSLWHTHKSYAFVSVHWTNRMGAKNSHSEKNANFFCVFGTIFLLEIR